MASKAGICCLMALLLLCGSCSGCTINNRIEASGGFYTQSGSMDERVGGLSSDNTKIR